MPGQWEFQIGPVGAPDVGDEVMIARWLLHRLGEQFGIVCTFAAKPVKGDWNGAPLQLSSNQSRTHEACNICHRALPYRSLSSAELMPLQVSDQDRGRG